jgi:hypothetical protein
MQMREVNRQGIHIQDQPRRFVPILKELGTLLVSLPLMTHVRATQHLSTVGDDGYGFDVKIDDEDVFLSHGRLNKEGKVQENTAVVMNFSKETWEKLRKKYSAEEIWDAYQNAHR